MRLESLKGDLAIIWVAAHFRKSRLSKRDITKASIKNGVAILLANDDEERSAGMTFRECGQCLVGLARIHHRKVEYLYNDCNEALSKLKLQVRGRSNKVTLAKDVSGKADGTLLDQKHPEDDLDLELPLDIDLPLPVGGLRLGLPGDDLSDAGSAFRDPLEFGLGEHQADENDITMHEEPLSIEKSRRRTSFELGREGSLHLDLDLDALHGDVDIDISFGEEEIPLQEGHSQQDLDGESIGVPSVEIGRGAAHDVASSIGLLDPDNLSVDVPSIAAPGSAKGSLAPSHASHEPMLLTPNRSALRNLDLSALDAEAPLLLDESLHPVELPVSVHASLAGSVTASVATDEIARLGLGVVREGEEETPAVVQMETETPRKRRKVGRGSQGELADADPGILPAVQRQRKKGGRRKLRFPRDDRVDLGEEERRMDASQLLVERNLLHIWREPRLARLGFEDLWKKPLAEAKPPARFEALFRERMRLPAELAKDRMEDDKERRDKELGMGTGMDAAEEEDHKRVEFADDLEQHLLGPEDLLDNISMPSLAEIPADTDAASDRGTLEDHFMNGVRDEMAGFAADAEMDPIAAEMESLRLSNIALDDSAAATADEDGFAGHEDGKFQRDDVDSGGDVDGSSGGAVDPRVREWTQRTAKAYAVLDHRCRDEIYFDEFVTKDRSREMAAAMFYEMLVFKNHGLVDVKQDTEQPFGRILVSKTEEWDRHKKRSRKYSQRLSGIHQSPSEPSEHSQN